MKNGKIILFRLFVSCLLVFLIPGALMAYTFTIEDPLHNKDLLEVINTFIDTIFYLSLAAVPVAAVVTGLIIITAAGDAAKIASAKRIITWAVIGLMIVLLSKGIMSLVNGLFE